MGQTAGKPSKEGEAHIRSPHRNTSKREPQLGFLLLEEFIFPFKLESHYIKLTLLKSSMLCFLEYLQNCYRYRNISPAMDSLSIRSHSLLSLHPEAFGNCSLVLSLWTCLTLDLSYKHRLCGLLWLASFSKVSNVQPCCSIYKIPVPHFS